MVQSGRKLKSLCSQSNTRRNKGNKNNIPLHVNIHVPKSELNLYIKIPINLKVLI